MTTEKQLATIQPQEAGITRASLQHTQGQLALLEEFVKDVLRPHQDFGIIPGTTKPTLLKPGASNIISAFNCHAEPHVDTEILDRSESPHASYTVHVDVVSNLTGNTVSRGFGQCNSHEKKYRYRMDQRRCPECGASAIIKGRQEYGGGWLCWAKRDGCGAKFDDGDDRVEGQGFGQIDNPDPLDQANTYLKMAIKRAEVDAALRLPGVARFFTQDIEDIMGTGDGKDPEDTPPSKPPTDRTRTPAPKPESAAASTLTEAQLRAAVDHEGISWGRFEVEILKTAWATWVQRKGTPAGALARLVAWQKDPPAKARPPAGLAPSGVTAGAGAAPEAGVDPETG